MRRQLKFKGQTRKAGEKIRGDGKPIESNWVYGGVMQGEFVYSIIYEYITYDKKIVYTDTLCQYTGLRDKTGKEIYENDILKVEIDDNEYRNYLVKFDEKDLSYELFGNDDLPFRMCFIKGNQGAFEIIGNIFDNPELFKNADKHAGEYADNEVLKSAT